MTGNWLRDVRDLALSGRLRAIGGRKGSARPNSCRDRSNHRCIADREESQDKDSFHRMREDRLGLRRGRSGSGQNDYRGACTRRQPRKSDMGPTAEVTILDCDIRFASRPTADIGSRFYDGVDAPRRHRCAKVEVLSTT
jgi:hypothetical protein